MIRRRLENLTGEIANALEQLGFTKPVGRQVVLTGGGAELKGIADYAQGALGHTVRIARPTLPSLPDAHSGPGFATLAGLAQYAASNELDLKFRMPTLPPTQGAKAPAGGVLGRLISAFRTGY